MPVCRFYKYTRRVEVPVCCSGFAPEDPNSSVPYSEQGGVPESIRLAKSSCPLYWAPTGTSTIPCNNNPGIALTTSHAPVSVQTTPASQTTLLRQIQTAQVANDPTDPDARFVQYFRPKPPQPDILVVGPERLPNKDPLPRDPPCVGFSRFAGSTAGVN